MIVTKFVPLIRGIVNEISDASSIALVGMLCASGVLLLLGNEHGAKKLAKNAFYGYLLIQIASKLI